MQLGFTSIMVVFLFFWLDCSIYTIPWIFMLFSKNLLLMGSVTARIVYDLFFINIITQNIQYFHYMPILNKKEILVKKDLRIMHQNLNQNQIFDFVN